MKHTVDQIFIECVMPPSARCAQGAARQRQLMGNRLGQFVVPAAAGIVAAASGAGAVFIGLSILLGSSIFSVKRQ